MRRFITDNGEMTKRDHGPGLQIRIFLIQQVNQSASYIPLSLGVESVLILIDKKGEYLNMKNSRGRTSGVDIGDQV
jgi:hypothetical protein